MKDDEKKIEKAFARLNEESVKEAPAFGALWSRAEAAAQARRGRRWVRGVALASVVAALAVLLTRPQEAVRSPSGNDSFTQSARIMDWEAPTDFLLEDSAFSVLDTEADLEFSLPDSSDLADFAQTKGARG